MPKPVLTLITYRARPGSEEELAGVLRTRVARLGELGLIADRPHFAASKDDGGFVECFWWAHEGAEELARDHSEAQELWMRVEDLCVPGGVQEARLTPLD